MPEGLLGIEIPSAKVTNLTSFNFTGNFTTMIGYAYNNVSQTYVVGNWHPAMLYFIRNSPGYPQHYMTIPTTGNLIGLMSDINSSNVYALTNSAEYNGGDVWVINTLSFKISHLTNFSLPPPFVYFISPALYNPIQKLLYIIAESINFSNTTEPDQYVYLTIDITNGEINYLEHWKVNIVPYRVFYTHDYFIEVGFGHSNGTVFVSRRNWMNGDISVLGSSGCIQEFTPGFKTNAAFDYITDIVYGIMSCDYEQQLTIMWWFSIKNSSHRGYVTNKDLYLIEDIAFVELS